MSENYQARAVGENQEEFIEEGHLVDLIEELHEKNKAQTPEVGFEEIEEVPTDETLEVQEIAGGYNVHDSRIKIPTAHGNLYFQSKKNIEKGRREVRVPYLTHN